MSVCSGRINFMCCSCICRDVNCDSFVLKIPYSEIPKHYGISFSLQYSDGRMKTKTMAQPRMARSYEHIQADSGI